FPHLVIDLQWHDQLPRILVKHRDDDLLDLGFLYEIAMTDDHGPNPRTRWNADRTMCVCQSGYPNRTLLVKLNSGLRREGTVCASPPDAVSQCRIAQFPVACQICPQKFNDYHQSRKRCGDGLASIQDRNGIPTDGITAPAACASQSAGEERFLRRPAR